VSTTDIARIAELEARVAELRVDLLAANERAKTLRPILRRCADALADEVAVLVCRQVIDSRSPAADALLDYRNDCLSPQLMISPRADRIADLEVDLLAADERIAQLETALRDVRDRMNAATDSDLQDEDWHCYVRYDAEMVSIINRALRAGGAT